MADVFINGKALASLSTYIDQTEDVRARASYKFPVASIFGRAGGLATAPTVPGRTLTLGGRILTSANTAAARLTAEHALKDWLGNGGLLLVEVDEGNPPVLAIDAYLEELKIVPIGHPLQAVGSEVTLTLNAPDPLWRAADGGTPVGLAANATRYACPLGTAPSAPIVRLMGAATNPTFVIRDSGGAAQVTIAVTLTLGANDFLELNCETGIVQKSVAGTVTRCESVLTSGTFPFALDPEWGDYSTANWPTAEVDLGKGELLYTKRYW